MDHNESLGKRTQLMQKKADRAHDTETELEAGVAIAA